METGRRALGRGISDFTFGDSKKTRKREFARFWKKSPTFCEAKGGVFLSKSRELPFPRFFKSQNVKSEIARPSALRPVSM